MLFWLAFRRTSPEIRLLLAQAYIILQRALQKAKPKGRPLLDRSIPEALSYSTQTLSTRRRQSYSGGLDHNSIQIVGVLLQPSPAQRRPHECPRQDHSQPEP